MALICFVEKYDKQKIPGILVYIDNCLWAFGTGTLYEEATRKHDLSYPYVVNDGRSILSFQIVIVHEHVIQHIL